MKRRAPWTDEDDTPEGSAETDVDQTELGATTDGKGEDDGVDAEDEALDPEERAAAAEEDDQQSGLGDFA